MNFNLIVFRVDITEWNENTSSLIFNENEYILLLD